MTDLIPESLAFEEVTEDKSLSKNIKARLNLALNYDYTRLPERVSFSIKENIQRLCWSDHESFFFGTNAGNRMDIPLATFEEMEGNTGAPIYRGGVYWYIIQKGINHSFGKGKLKIEIAPTYLDPGYIDFLIDMLSGNLGVERAENGMDLWRKHNSITEQVGDFDRFYKTSKHVGGFYDVVLDMIDQIPELAPKKVWNAVSIGNMVYDGLGYDELTTDIIPKHMIKDVKVDTNRAKGFFDLVCPDEYSQHNLLLATVYPYFKRSNEKFFVLGGPGGNGKTTYLDHFNAFLGRKCETVDLNSMGGSGHERLSATAMLKGKLVYRAPEVDLNNPKFLSELKKIATADEMVARQIGGNSFSFKPEGVLFADNNTGAILGSTDAILRRIVGVNFIGRRISHQEIEPYFKWVRTLEGAASLFVYAYSYYEEDCQSEFVWNDVKVSNDDDDFSSESMVVEELIERFTNEDKKTRWAVPISRLSKTLTKEEREDIIARYGLEKATARTGDTTARVVRIKNIKRFKEECNANGYEIGE